MQEADLGDLAEMQTAVARSETGRPACLAGSQRVSVLLVADTHFEEKGLGCVPRPGQWEDSARWVLPDAFHVGVCAQGCARIRHLALNSYATGSYCQEASE